MKRQFKTSRDDEVVDVGEIRLDDQGFPLIYNNQYIDINNNVPVIQGPTVLSAQQTSVVYQIVNFDSFTEYTINLPEGQYTRSDDTITVSASVLSAVGSVLKVATPDGVCYLDIVVGPQLTGTYTQLSGSFQSSTSGLKPVVTAVGSILYKYGGFKDNSLWAYDTQTQTPTWVAKGSYGNARDGATSGLYNNTIYILGGRSNPGDTLTKNMVSYNTQTNTWTEVFSGDNRAGWYSGGCMVGNIFYQLGGYVNDITSTTDAFLSYNVDTKVWHTLPQYPDGRLMNGVLLPHKDKALYALGYQVGNLYGQIKRFDISTNTWTPLAPMPTPVHNGTATVIDDYIYYFGGSLPNGNYTNLLQVYSISRDEWLTLPSGSFSLAATGSAVIDNKMYVVGGWTGTTSTIQQDAWVIT